MMWREIAAHPWRQILISGFAGASAFVCADAIYRAYQADIPPLVIDKQGRSVIVKGDVIRITVSQERDRPACLGGKAITRLVHYPPKVQPGIDNFDAVVSIPDDDLYAGAALGRRKFDLYLHLPVPLPQYNEGSWYVGVNIYNGCNFLSRLWPDSPVAAPLTAAKIE